MDACIALRTMVMRRRGRLPAGRRRRRRRLRPGRRARGVPAQARRARGRDRARRAGVRTIGTWGRRPMKVLMIDNYDSFTYNLVHLFEELGAEVVTCPQRRDHASTRRVALAPDRLVVSPGPGRPADAGVSIELIRRARPDDADARRLPRPPGDRRGVRRRGRSGARRSCTARRASSRHDGLASYAGLPDEIEVGPLPLARRDHGAGRARRHRAHERRRGDGCPPRTRSRSRASSSIPRVVLTPARARDGDELPGQA